MRVLQFRSSCPSHHPFLPSLRLSRTKVNGREIGREQPVQLQPGALVDLSGAGRDLVFQVMRDSQAHA